MNGKQKGWLPAWPADLTFPCRQFHTLCCCIAGHRGDGFSSARGLGFEGHRKGGGGPGSESVQRRRSKTEIPSPFAAEADGEAGEVPPSAIGLCSFYRRGMSGTFSAVSPSGAMTLGKSRARGSMLSECQGIDGEKSRNTRLPIRGRLSLSLMGNASGTRSTLVSIDLLYENKIYLPLLHPHLRGGVFRAIAGH